MTTRPRTKRNNKNNNNNNNFSLIVTQLKFTYFSNGPDDVGRWQRATFFLLFFLFFQGTSIGLVRTNHALLSLVDTILA